MTTRRNDPCPSGSGKKFKQCHGKASRTAPSSDLLFGQLVSAEGITIPEANPPHTLRPEDKLPLIDLRERMNQGGPLDPSTTQTLREVLGLGS
jgi:hypothetical protein